MTGPAALALAASSTLAAPSARLVPPGAISSTVALSATAAVSSTVAELSLPESLARIQVQRVYMKGAEEIGLTLPDGTSRVVVQTSVGRSSVRMGAYYNIINGKIEAWLTYAIPILRDGTEVQLAMSDVIGFGELYLRQRYLERSRTVPLGVGHAFRWGNLLLNAQRTSWRLVPLDNPDQGDVENIDSYGVEANTSDVIPDIVEMLRQEHTRLDETRVRYRHAFRGLGGAVHFDRLDADLKLQARGFQPDDQVQLRGFWGQAFNVSPSLPLRETYGLGGANAVKGYRFEEFRGPGVLFGGVEYALRTPLAFAVKRWHLEMSQTDALFFAEDGRIQSGWTRGATPLKWSVGLGLKFMGRALGSHRSVFRFYAAQAGEYPQRKPVFYALADVG